MGRYYVPVGNIPGKPESFRMLELSFTLVHSFCQETEGKAGEEDEAGFT